MFHHFRESLRLNKFKSSLDNLGRKGIKPLKSQGFEGKSQTESTTASVNLAHNLTTLKETDFVRIFFHTPLLHLDGK